MKRTFGLIILALQATVGLLAQNYAVGETFKGVTAEGDTFTVKVTDAVAKTIQVGDGEKACMDNVDHAVTLPQTVEGYRITAIGTRAFDARYTMTAVTIPEGVTRIGENAFYYAHAIKSVKLPSTVKTIDMAAFAWMFGLEEITLNEGIDSIKSYAFSGNRSLKKIAFPSSVRYIEGQIVSECPLLTEVVFPKTMQATEFEGTFQFYNCSSLKKATLPTNLKKLPWYMFVNCTSLEELNWRELTIEEIGANAFNNTGFKDVIIPATVTNIQMGAFQNCSWLTSVRSLATVPPGVDSRSFEGVCDRAALVVPKGSLAAYQAKENWAKFASITEWEDYADGTTFQGMTFDGFAMTCQVKSAADETCVIGDGTNPAIASSVGDNLVLPAVVKGYTVVGIADKAFANQPDVKHVVLKSAAVLDASAGAFADKAYADATLYVQRGQKKAYAANATWSRFAGMGEDVLEGKEFIDTLGVFNNVIVDLRYRVTDYNNKEVEVLSNTKWQYAHRGEVNIPEAINGYTVTGVGEGAFGFHRFGSITIPKTVKTIGPRAFSFCIYLEHLTLPEAVKVIPRGMCEGCQNMKDITFADDITSIGAYAFSRCESLEFLEIPATVTNVGDEDGHVGTEAFVINYVTIHGNPPAAPDNNFDRYDDIILRVDDGQVENFRNAPCWKNFTHIEATGNGIPVTAEHFPDANLRKGLQQTFGDKISAADERNAETLDLRNLGISDVTGLDKYFVLVKELRLDNNKIAQLKLGQKFRLERLYATNNVIDTLHYDTIPQLRTLDLSHNKLTRLSLTETHLIETVKLAYNNLEFLHFHNTPNVDSLDVANNSFSGGGIVGTYLGTFGKISYVNFDNNDFGGIPVYGKSTKFISARNCGVTRITNPNLTLPIIEELHLDNNKIMYGLGIYDCCDSLRILTCSHNGLTELAVHSQKMEYIDMSYNSISSVYMPKEEKLTYLNLNNNALAELDLTLIPNMEELYLNRNGISKLDLALIPKLRILSAINNKVASLNPAECPGMTYLNMTSNNLGALHTENLPLLEYLNVTGNKLYEINLKNNPLLKEFYADRNQLWDIDLTGNPNLNILTLSYNSIPTLDLSQCTQMTYDNGYVDLSNQQVIGELLMFSSNELGLLMGDDAKADCFSDLTVAGKKVDTPEIRTYNDKKYLIVPVEDAANMGKVVTYNYNPTIAEMPDERLEVKYSITSLTGIPAIVGGDVSHVTQDADAFYTLDGRKLTGTPTQRGIYIYKGKKVVIK